MTSNLIGQDILLCAHVLPYAAQDGTTIPEEKFVVHTWPGLLPGMNSGFNHHGLFFSIDHLYPKHVVPGKIGQWRKQNNSGYLKCVHILNTEFSLNSFCSKSQLSQKYNGIWEADVESEAHSHLQERSRASVVRSP